MTKYRTYFIVTIISIFTILLLDSCYKERLKIHKFSGGAWNPEFAVPLFYGNLDMHYAIDKSKDLWFEYPDGLLSIVYKGEQITKVGHNVIDIPNQGYDTTMQIILPPTLQIGDSVSSMFSINTEFSAPSNERYDSLLIKSGKLIIEISADLNHDSYVEITIPAFTKYGNAIVEKIELPYLGSSPTIVTKEISLTDYWCIINRNGDTNNIVTEYIKVLVNKGNNPDNSPYNIDLKQSIEDIEYKQLFGYFSQYTVDIDLKKIDISMFNHRAIFDASLEEVILNMKFENSFGIPVDVTFTDLYVEKDGVRKDITSTLLPTISLNYPDINNVGNIDTTNLTFYSGNSNIVDVINFFPKKFFFAGVSVANPLGNIIPNFVVDTSKISIQTDIEVPLYGRYIVYSLSDTAALDLKNDYNWDEIVSIDINFNTKNYFPLEAAMQIYLTDTNMVIIDSIFTGLAPLVKAAIPGLPPEYRVTVPEFHTVTAHLTNQKISTLENAAHMIVKGSSSTYDQGNKITKIYSDYGIEFQVSMKVNYKTDY
ncbi:MAG: hypothetical protein KAG84_03765 [Bacteroidales bacterium]|nr:hypothetical protein [Bacteroidales bacterium]